MSEKGSRYIDGELENAINGVRQMKLLMEQTSSDHQEILSSLEDTKKKKEVCWYQGFLRCDCFLQLVWNFFAIQKGAKEFSPQPNLDSQVLLHDLLAYNSYKLWIHFQCGVVELLLWNN